MDVPGVGRAYRIAFNECVRRGIIPENLPVPKTTSALWSIFFRNQRNNMRRYIGATVKQGTAAYEEDDDDFNRQNAYIIDNTRTFSVKSCNLDETSRRLSRVLARIGDFLMDGMDDDIVEYFMFTRESPVVKKLMCDLKWELRRGGLDAVEQFLNNKESHRQ
jgi:hypothetical protein